MRCPVDVQVVQKCEKLGAQKAMYVPGDMSDPADPERVFKYAVENLGENWLHLTLHKKYTSYLE